MSSILPQTPSSSVVSPSTNSPAKGVFDRFLSSPQTSPSTTPRPPTEAQKRVKGLVEKFELAAKSVTSPPPVSPARLKSSWSSRSLVADAEDGPSTAPESPTKKPAAKKAEPVKEAEDFKPEVSAKKEDGELKLATKPKPTLLSDLPGILSPRPHHGGASSPFVPSSPIISAPSPLTSRPNSPLVEPEPVANPITSLTSAHLEPPSEASPIILSPIRETGNTVAGAAYGFPEPPKEEEKVEEVARPPRQPSPEPEAEAETTPASASAEEEKAVEVVVEAPTPVEPSPPTSSASNSQPSTASAETPAASSPITTSSDSAPTPNPEDSGSKDSSTTPTPSVPEHITENAEPAASHPLTHRHTLFFSDTSPTKKASGSTSSAYAHGLQPLFSCGTVEEFAGSWKTLRRYLSETVSSEDGLGGLKQDSNFHFFLEGISPMWEDPMNKLGGRLTLSLPTNLLDSTFTSLVLLLVGSVIEIDALPTQESHGGICGVVASRRQRGDRIEVWLGGPEQPDDAWVERVKECLSRELGVEAGRYKKHFG